MIYFRNDFIMKNRPKSANLNKTQSIKDATSNQGTDQDNTKIVL